MRATPWGSWVAAAEPALAKRGSRAWHRTDNCPNILLLRAVTCAILHGTKRFSQGRTPAEGQLARLLPLHVRRDPHAIHDVLGVRRPEADVRPGLVPRSLRAAQAAVALTVTAGLLVGPASAASAEVFGSSSRAAVHSAGARCRPRSTRLRHPRRTAGPNVRHGAVRPAGGGVRPHPAGRPASSRGCPPDATAERRPQPAARGRLGAPTGAHPTTLDGPGQGCRSGLGRPASANVADLRLAAAVCSPSDFAARTGSALVSFVKASTSDCVNTLFNVTGSTARSIFAEAQMTSVAYALRDVSASYPGNSSTGSTQLVLSCGPATTSSATTRRVVGELRDRAASPPPRPRWTPSSPARTPAMSPTPTAKPWPRPSS